MNVKVVKVTLSRPIEVEIPDVCIGCGADFSLGGLVEDQYTATQQAVKRSDGGVAEYADGLEEVISEDFFVIGYRCKCGRQLVTTEGDHASDADCVTGGALDEAGACGICGVAAGDPCGACDGRRYHMDDCEDMNAGKA